MGARDISHFMFFKRKKQAEDTDERLERIETAFRRLEEEWTEVYHRFRVLQMRTAKQVQRLDRAPEVGEAQPVGSEGSDSKLTLTPRAQLIQNQILARRKANGG